MKDNTVIKVESIYKVYNKDSDQPVFALQDVSFNVQKGEFIAIIGASGSGKSTIMNILGCLDKPSDGTYYLDGQDVSNIPDDKIARVRNKKIGFVFQAFNLLPKTSALENVELPLLYSDATHIREKAQKALEGVNLKDRMHHHPNELSGGQQQRVAIARAIVNDPEIILADEPTGNLDTKSSEEIMKLFHDFHKKGRTIIIITHESDIAENAKRIIKLNDGKITSDKKN
jgi:putative ABC transport system ATP-binding protein